MTHPQRLTFALVAGIAAIAAAIWLPGLAAGAIVAAVMALMLVLLRRPAVLDTRIPSTATPAAEDEALQPMRDLIRLLEPLREGVMLLGEGQVVLAANEAAAHILGRPLDQVTGVSLIRATRDHELVQLLRESSGSLSEISIADGRRVLAYATPFDLAPVETLLTLQDVTALRRAERARQDLVANVSHELRTPITAALVLAETLEDGVDDPEQAAHFLGRLTGELERLKEMVERLLRLSRIESQSEQFELRALDVDSLIRESIEHMRPVGERAWVTVEAAPQSGLRVIGDEQRVVEVITNLIDNAIRFSPTGGNVTVAAGQAEGVAGEMVRVSVRDQGPGILPSERLRVFERFYTGEESRTSASHPTPPRSGTGLGLAIARHIVSRLGGEIWVADETPGATLCFTLPLAPSPIEPGADVEPALPALVEAPAEPADQ